MNRQSLFRASFLALVAFFILAGCFSTGNNPVYSLHASGQVVMLDKTNFTELTVVPKCVSMVEYYSPTCPPCQKMDSVVTDLGVRFSGKALIGKVNVRTDDTLQYVASIVWTPTFLFYNEGKETRRVIGIQAEDSLAMIIDSLVSANNQ